MMLTIRNSTSDDCATVAALWNAKRIDPASCWTISAPPTTAQQIGSLMTILTMVVADQDGSAVGFGLWGGANLNGICADTQDVYYRIMLAYANAGVQANTLAGTGIVNLGGGSQEKDWMDALGVLVYTPIGFTPITSEQDQSERTPVMLQATCNLSALAAALTARLA